MGNTECGVYSLFFIITMLTGVHKKPINDSVSIPDRGLSEVESVGIAGSRREKRSKMNMRQKIRLFKHHTIPDKYIEKYRNVYFND
jgi:hypothetical protein